MKIKKFFLEFFMCLFSSAAVFCIFSIFYVYYRVDQGFNGEEFPGEFFVVAMGCMGISALIVLVMTFFAGIARMCFEELQKMKQVNA